MRSTQLIATIDSSSFRCYRSIEHGFLCSFALVWLCIRYTHLTFHVSRIPNFSLCYSEQLLAAAHITHMCISVCVCSAMCQWSSVHGRESPSITFTFDMGKHAERIANNNFFDRLRYERYFFYFFFIFVCFEKEKLKIQIINEHFHVRGKSHTHNTHTHTNSTQLDSTTLDSSSKYGTDELLCRWRRETSFVHLNLANA